MFTEKKHENQLRDITIKHINEFIIINKNVNLY